MTLEFLPEELAVFCNGVWNKVPETSFSGIETDSRKELSGKLFVALAGEKFDAHDFLDDAVAKGAALCVRRDKVHLIPDGAAALVVDDTLKAYQDMASGHRRKMTALKVAAVTGSVGKTSVKEMLRAIFISASGEDAVLATQGNTNNHIGVPQNLLRLTPDIRYAVVEMGTSSPGEIAVLSRIARPDTAVVNSIAPCHLEKLIDLDGVAREKGDIFRCLSSEGTAIIPGDIEQSRILRLSAGSHTIQTFGDNAGCDVTANFLRGDLSGSSFELVIGREHHIVEWQLTGRHQCRNASAAAAVALAFGIAPEVIAKGLANTTLPGMRGKVVKSGNATIFNDSYNASPASMAAVLKMVSESVTNQKVVLLLGTMLELGTNSKDEHRKTLLLARRLFPDAVICTVGDGFAGIEGSDHHYAVSTDAAEDIFRLTSQQVVIVAKGSRGTALEKALPPEAR